MESEKDIARRRWEEKETGGDEETGRKRKRKRNTHIQHGERREIVSWGEREPLAERGERKSGSRKGRGPLEQKRGKGTERKITPLPQRHPVLGLRKVCYCCP